MPRSRSFSCCGRFSLKHPTVQPCHFVAISFEIREYLWEKALLDFSTERYTTWDLGVKTFRKSCSKRGTMKCGDALLLLLFVGSYVRFFCFLFFVFFFETARLAWYHSLFFSRLDGAPSQKRCALCWLVPFLNIRLLKRPM